MLTYRASYDTNLGKRWLSVKAMSPEAARDKAQLGAPKAWKLINVYLV